MSLEKALAGRLGDEVTVVGVGNPLRGDDGAGPLVARGLRRVPGLRVVEAEEVPESHLARITAGPPDTIVLVDAVDLGAAPGAVALLRTSNLAAFAPTTHHVPLDLLATFLARETGAEVLVLAIQPGRTTLGAQITPAVEEAAALVAGALNRVIESRSRAAAGGEEREPW
jgi:hydrogenase 3 maturation protease